MNFIVIANTTITHNRFYLAGGDTHKDSATNARCISSKNMHHNKLLESSNGKMRATKSLDKIQLSSATDQLNKKLLMVTVVS